MNNNKQSVNHSSSATHRKAQRSTTLNRKYVKRPSAKNMTENSVAVKVNVSPKVKVKAQPYARKSTVSKQPRAGIIPVAKADTPAQPNPYAKAISARKPSPVKTNRSSELTARELKDRAIKQAMRSVATMNTGSAIAGEPASSNTVRPAQPTAKSTTKPQAKLARTKKRQSVKPMSTGNGKRFVLAFTCAAACVAALAFFVNINMPDISVRVAAMQTGIEASYPSYVPREYSLSNVLSETGKITMEFTKSNGAKFTITEEKSSWDSTALLNNYVKPNWQDGYATTREQGITIYIKNGSATWVNGGILYNLETSDDNLTKKQINSIAVSL